MFVFFAQLDEPYPSLLLASRILKDLLTLLIPVVILLNFSEQVKNLIIALNVVRGQDGPSVNNVIITVFHN